MADAVGQLHPPYCGDLRIVSLVPSLTELLCSLGLAEALVGRTGYCIHPRETLRAVPKVGGTKDVNVAKIAALRPTHLIVNIDENRRETVEALTPSVGRVIVTHPLGPLDNPPLYRMLGEIFRREAEAERLCADFERARHGLAEVPKLARRVLYLIWKDPWMTVSRDTYLSRMLALIDWHTLPDQARARYPTVRLDEAWSDTVDTILLSSEPYRFGAAHVSEIAAMQQHHNKNVRLVDGELLSWYGSRAIAGLDYLRQLALRN